jgi:signal transduction histidine kinase
MALSPISLSIPSYFLPAERASELELARQQDGFTAESLFRTLFDAVPEGVVILNADRQITFYNQAFRTVCTQHEELIGMRPGEALQCVHADEMPGGCGTSIFCQTCGAAEAIQAAREQRRSVNECRIVRTEEAGSTALDLRVTATPFQYGEESFIIFTASDISHEKRRQILERIFFHDILNTAGAIMGVAQLLEEFTPEELETLPEYGSMLLEASNLLLEEIQSQRQLLAAESGDLVIQPTEIHCYQLLSDLGHIYRHHQVAHGRKIALTDVMDDLALASDSALLSRVIGNMIKNALEASPQGATVTLGYQREGDRIRLWVHNVGQIPYAAQLQIFQRSFSTKGNGRGLGTYSMKLLAERYLHGEIGFTSTAKEGTTFFCLLPIELKL